jgi:hypothetical protein
MRKLPINKIVHITEENTSLDSTEKNGGTNLRYETEKQSNTENLGERITGEEIFKGHQYD